MHLPELDIDYGDLYGMLFLPIRSKLLLAGIELRVFNHLAEPVSAGELAQAIGAHPRNMGLFLDGLAAIDLVQKRNGLYQNTPEAQAFLVEGSQTYLGQLLSFMAKARALESRRDCRRRKSLSLMLAGLTSDTGADNPPKKALFSCKPRSSSSASLPK